MNNMGDLTFVLRRFNDSPSMLRKNEDYKLIKKIKNKYNIYPNGNNPKNDHRYSA